MSAMSSTSSDGEISNPIADVDVNEERRDGCIRNAPDAVNRPSLRPVGLFALGLALDVLNTVFLCTPLIPGVQQSIVFVWSQHTLSKSLLDVFFLAGWRVLESIRCSYLSFKSNAALSPSPFPLYHANGEKKSREELEEESLEEPWRPFLKRFIRRRSFLLETLAFVSLCWGVSKCLTRMYVEIGVEKDADVQHSNWWIAVGLSALLATVENATAEKACFALGAWGCYRRQLRRRSSACGIGLGSVQMTESLANPLLPNGSSDQTCREDANDILLNESASRKKGVRGHESASRKKGVRGLSSSHDTMNDVERDEEPVVSDISSDADYKAGWTDLLRLCLPDTHLILAAFLFLLAAAVAQIYIPHFTGRALDAVVDGGTDGGSGNGCRDIWCADGFIWNIQFLAVAAILAGVFSGVRGAFFTAVGGRVNVRLRIMLMESLMKQDIGFFDVTKTGDITSRLCSDTTLVGDQVTLNVNVFLRSLVQAVGVLVFMVFISWQLTLLAFISVPVITVLSKWYGGYIRSLTKLMQKKLADANAVGEAVLGSMPTVRAFGGEKNELHEYEGYIQNYLALNTRSAIAYFGYAATTTALPQLVIAVVLFYGGLLVQSQGPDHISSGQLVSFLLYLSSLSDAFNNMGSIFSSLTQAVGAADKVFELMHRQPRIRQPSVVEIRVDNEASLSAMDKFHKRGLHPDQCLGEVSLTDVFMHYPARPKRPVLKGMTLIAPPGAVVAIVGESGGGKSSIMSLIQHLYEPTSGAVCIDGNQVHDLSYEWLSRHVSVVSQEPTLFARSIHRNIIFGLEGSPSEPTLEQVKEAAQLANASTFVETLPRDYETDVGERGVQLSGGQRQRIAIARALVRRPRILLLDEATSALDAESEAAVQDAIDGMLNRDLIANDGTTGLNTMTVIIVAHRLSTVRNADVIYVVEGGCVVEEGSHSDLIKNEDGPYFKLISRQMKVQDQLEGNTAQRSLCSS